jgi:hypothetical protein
MSATVWGERDVCYSIECIRCRIDAHGCITAVPIKGQNELAKTPPENGLAKIYGHETTTSMLYLTMLRLIIMILQLKS